MVGASVNGTMVGCKEDVKGEGCIVIKLIGLLVLDALEALVRGAIEGVSVFVMLLIGISVGFPKKGASVTGIGSCVDKLGAGVALDCGFAVRVGAGVGPPK